MGRNAPGRKADPAAQQNTRLTIAATAGAVGAALIDKGSGTAGWMLIGVCVVLLAWELALLVRQAWEPGSLPGRQQARLAVVVVVMLAAAWFTISHFSAAVTEVAVTPVTAVVPVPVATTSTSVATSTSTQPMSPTTLPKAAASAPPCTAFVTTRPIDMMSDGKGASPYDRSEIRKKYVGLCVRWTLPYLSFSHPSNLGDVAFAFFAPVVGSDDASVGATLTFSQSPDLRFAKPRELLLVQGRITSVGSATIDLEDAIVSRPEPTARRR